MLWTSYLSLSYTSKHPILAQNMPFWAFKFLNKSMKTSRSPPFVKVFHKIRVFFKGWLPLVCSISPGCWPNIIFSGIFWESFCLNFSCLFNLSRLPAICQIGWNWGGATSMSQMGWQVLPFQSPRWRKIVFRHIFTFNQVVAGGEKHKKYPPLAIWGAKKRCQSEGWRRVSRRWR